MAHYIQKWFRFKLQEWIVSRMREIESKEGVYSLEGWTRRRTAIRDHEDSAGQHRYAKEHVPSLVGEFQDASGTCMAADVSMMQKPLDVSKMNIEWVHATEDPLFRDLSRNDNERYLLYLTYARDMDIAGVATSIGCRIYQKLKAVWKRSAN